MYNIRIHATFSTWKRMIVFIIALGASLFASCLLQKLSKVADDEEEVELSLALEQNSS